MNDIDRHLIKLYKSGFSINYLVNVYYKYVNANSVVKTVDTVIVSRNRITKLECRRYVYSLLLDNLLCV